VPVLVTSTDTPAFIEAIDHRQALILEVAGVDWDARLPGWRERYSAYYAAAFASGSAVLVVSLHGGAYGGSCIASIQDEFRRSVCGEGIGYINGLYVTRLFRRRHVGTELVRTATAWLRDRGCLVIRLHPSTGSGDFYRRLGFTPIQELEYRAEGQ
jgi:GNAT superfamily N-acetyltransferase